VDKARTYLNSKHEKIMHPETDEIVKK